MKKEDLNEIIKDVIYIRDKADKNIDNACVTFSYGKGNMLLITKENYNVYEENMRKMYNIITSGRRLISFEFFQKTVHELILNGEKNIDLSVSKIFEEMPICNFVIMRPMFGAYLKKEKIFKKGEYIFISKNNIKEYLQQYCEEYEATSFLVNNEKITFLCYVEIRIDAKEEIFAKLEADRKMAELDNLIRFMSGNIDKNSGIGIFNFNTRLNAGYININTNNNICTISEQSINHPVRGIDIDNEFFFTKENGNEEIWKLFLEKSPNEIQKRIFSSINWIGKAINEEDEALSFLQCLFSIECLLQDQVDYITKSITAQISEYAAFIVGYDLKTRIEVEVLLKKLYGLRSKLAHGKYDSNIVKERQEAIWLAKQIIINFLIKPEFIDITRMDELRNRITDLKYK